VVSNSSSSSSLVDIIKSLMEEGNNGSILDFFKNLGSTRGQNRTFVKSIEILSGSEIQSQGRNTESTPVDQCTATAEVNFEINKEDC